MTSALVVGGTGFIGLAVVDSLLARGIDVTVSRRRRSITALVRKRPVELVRASLDEPEALEEAMRGHDMVFVTAGYYPRYSLDLEEAVETGLRGVRNACEAALRADVGRFVYTSSTGALAQAPASRPADERDIAPERPEGSVYRALKWAMEREVERHVARGLPAVTILPGGCFGPGDLRLGTGGILVGAVRGLLPWYVDGIVPAIDVADVAEAHVEAALAPSPSPRYCVAGHSITVGELLRIIVARYGGRVPDVCLGPEEARDRADADERRAAPTKSRVPIPRELVDVVIRLHPGLAEELLDEAGGVSRRIHVVVDGRSAVWLPERFATRVAPGMTVAFFPAVAGG